MALSLACLSSESRCAYLLVNFVCPLLFSGTEAKWLKTVPVHTAEHPGRSGHLQTDSWEWALIQVWKFWGEWYLPDAKALLWIFQPV